jgi:hypothetical protein
VLLVYVAAQYTLLLTSIWQAQQCLNPSRDWSVAVVRPDAVIHAPAEGVGGVGADAAGGGGVGCVDATPRVLVSFDVGRLSCSLLREHARAQQEEEGDVAGGAPRRRRSSSSCVFDLCVKGLSGAVRYEDKKVVTTAHVINVHINASGSSESATPPYSLLSQVRSYFDIYMIKRLNSALIAPS